MPMAISEDGLIEAIDRPENTYFRAVQWHLEFLYTVDGPSRRLFRSFVAACARQSAEPRYGRSGVCRR